MTDVIIIGAGAAGLCAARDLAKAKKSVMIIEARDRIGGRIHTINGKGFSTPVEAGAEFMHGDLPLTKALMQQAHVPYVAGEGRSWSIQKNELTESELFDDDWDRMVKSLQQLEHDMTIGQFLESYFSGKSHSALRDSVKKFVEGYDAADVNKASALSLKEEWSNENIKGYRPVGGYSQLMESLRSEIRLLNGQILLSCEVRSVIWSTNDVQIVTANNETHRCRKVLITVPIAVLKAGMIEFVPPLDKQSRAFQLIEVGGVIKFIVEFKDRLWERNDGRFRHMPNLNFLFSDAPVPTWWTQNPSDAPLLTGWLAGPVLKQNHYDNMQLQHLAFRSLAYLFEVSEEQIRAETKALCIVNWEDDKYAQGAYAYATLSSNEAIQALSNPAENTIYFAGEALYDGAEIGTVEAALATGKNVASRIVRDGW